MESRPPISPARKQMTRPLRLAFNIGHAARNLKRCQRNIPGMTLALLCLLGMTGCGPSAEEQAKKEARIRAEEWRNIELCRDDVSCGEQPKVTVDPSKEALHKWNDRWFIAPRQYGAGPSLALRWPKRDARDLGPNKRGPDYWLIQLYIRSYDIPPPPHGYGLIEAAERDGRIVKRETVRAGLDRVEYFPANAFTGEPAYVFYVATDRREPGGLPPVMKCNSDPPTKVRGGGAAGFMWRDGIFVEVLLREGHVCDEWPELFDEVMRTLGSVQPV